MANPEYGAGAFLKHVANLLPGSGRLGRRTRRRDAAIPVTKEEKRQQEKETEADRELRLEVFMRDHGCDRAFGDPLVFEGDAIATRSECHHIVFRSQGGSDEMSNLATLNVRAHQMVHDGKLSVAGNANETLIFTEKNLETGAIVRQWESPNPSGVSNRKSTEQGHQS